MVAAAGVAHDRTHYEALGVNPGVDADELRRAYRRQALRYHPDLTAARGDATAAEELRGLMIELNEAWRVLSKPSSRRHYDDSVGVHNPGTTNLDAPEEAKAPVFSPQPAPGARLSRRRAWARSVQAQIAKLSSLAGRSATQTYLVKRPRAPRADYERVVEAIVAGLCEDTESRVRAARAAGVTPLDLAVGATLIGIRTLADRLRRQAAVGVTTEMAMQAELLDRMWDVLAHELTLQLSSSLGGNPNVVRHILA